MGEAAFRERVIARTMLATTDMLHDIRARAMQSSWPGTRLVQLRDHIGMFGDPGPSAPTPRRTKLVTFKNEKTGETGKMHIFAKDLAALNAERRAEERNEARRLGRSPRGR